MDPEQRQRLKRAVDERVRQLAADEDLRRRSQRRREHATADGQ